MTSRPLRPRPPRYTPSPETSPLARGSASAAMVGVGAVASVGLYCLGLVLVAPMTPECAPMAPMACSGRPVIVVAALLLAAVGVRASWLGLTTARRVRALPRAPVPGALHRAAGGLNPDRLRLLDTGEPVAFCAGLRRPQVYVSRGAVAGLAADELAAVLAHEGAHARRRDPLRGLLGQACAEVLFFAPLLRSWQRRRQLGAELAADRAAVEHAGVPALAGALLSLAAGSTTGPGMSGFNPIADGSLDARVAALTNTGPPPPRPLPVRATAGTVAGLLGVGVLAVCLVPLVNALGG